MMKNTAKQIKPVLKPRSIFASWFMGKAVNARQKIQDACTQKEAYCIDRATD